MCNEDTSSTPILNKIIFVDHRRYLPMDHPWRKDKRYNGKVEQRHVPRMFSGDDLLKQLEKVEKYIPGKRLSSKKKEQGTSSDVHAKKRLKANMHDRKKQKRAVKTTNWKRKCIFGS